MSSPWSTAPEGVAAAEAAGAEAAGREGGGRRGRGTAGCGGRGSRRRSSLLHRKPARRSAERAAPEAGAAPAEPARAPRARRQGRPRRWSPSRTPTVEEPAVRRQAHPAQGGGRPGRRVIAGGQCVPGRPRPRRPAIWIVQCRSGRCRSRRGERPRDGSRRGGSRQRVGTVAGMRVATWNVNSLKVRLPRVEEWLADVQPDVVCMQETKLADDAFPALTFGALGYECAHFGQGQWNGVAILSKVGLDDVVTNFADGGEPDPDARIISARCGGIRRDQRATCPNGRSLDNPHYQYKLSWLAQLKRHVAARDDARSADDRRRRLQHRTGRRRRVRPEQVRRRPPTPARPSGSCSPSCATGAWSTCSASSTTPTGSTAGGTTGPATSTRAAACASTSCSAPRSVADRLAVVRDRPQRAQGSVALGPRAGHRRPRRLMETVPEQHPA